MKKNLKKNLKKKVFQFVEKTKKNLKKNFPYRNGLTLRKISVHKFFEGGFWRWRGSFRQKIFSPRVLKSCLDSESEKKILHKFSEGGGDQKSSTRKIPYDPASILCIPTYRTGPGGSYGTASQPTSSSTSQIYTLWCCLHMFICLHLLFMFICTAYK